MLQVKKSNRNLSWLISYQTCLYAFKYVWQGGNFVIKELFLSSMSAIRAQAEELKLFNTSALGL